MVQSTLFKRGLTEVVPKGEQSLTRDGAHSLL